MTSYTIETVEWVFIWRNMLIKITSTILSSSAFVEKHYVF